MPSISRPPIAARKISACAPSRLELVGVAEVLERLRRPSPSSRATVSRPMNGWKVDRAVEDDVLGAAARGARLDVPALDRRAESCCACGLIGAVRAYPSASRHTSTETSSTLSAIGGSGLVAFTHTPSSS